MNEKIENVLAVLDELRTNNDMTYYAYSKLHDEISLLDDLLKAQEPRVMTLDEAAAADEVWVEMWLHDSIMVAVLYITDDFKNFELELLGRNKKAFMLAEAYGHTWRCWTAKPTAEQRLEAKWG